MDSIVSVVILINLIVVITKTDTTDETLVGWAYLGASFVKFYWIEMATRCVGKVCQEFLSGQIGFGIFLIVHCSWQLYLASYYSSYDSPHIVYKDDENASLENKEGALLMTKCLIIC